MGFDYYPAVAFEEELLLDLLFKFYPQGLGI
jgi:hypothetical protein